jgi:hypothetical protein
MGSVRSLPFTQTRAKEGTNILVLRSKLESSAMLLRSNLFNLRHLVVYSTRQMDLSHPCCSDDSKKWNFDVCKEYNSPVFKLPLQYKPSYLRCSDTFIILLSGMTDPR